MYLPIFNLILILTIGKYVLSAMLYPYQNSIVREILDRTNANKFGSEFAHYLVALLYTIRIQAGIENCQRKNCRPEKNKIVATEELDDDEDPFEYLSFTEVKNTIDLLSLYISVNEQTLSSSQTVHKSFIKFTQTMK